MDTRGRNLYTKDVTLLERLQSQVREDARRMVGEVRIELEGTIDRTFPPTEVRGVPEDEPPDQREAVREMLSRLAGAEADARSAAKEALRQWFERMETELEGGASAMLRSASGKNPDAFGDALPLEKQDVLFDQVSGLIRQTFAKILDVERKEVERQIASIRGPRP